MAPIKVGLMGYGSSTKVSHLPLILPNPDLEVVAFLQRKKPAADVQPGSYCTIDHLKAKHYRAPGDFFADKDLELVIVCTHVDTHAEFAEKALLANKHVVVEKPFTITSAEADSLIALSQKQRRILAVYQNRRYESDFRTLQHLISLNAFGAITEVENCYDVDNPPCDSLCDPPRPGDGMMYGLGTHSIDQALVLFGLPESVTALTRGKQRDLVCTMKTTLVNVQPVHVRLKYYVRGPRGTSIKTGEDVQVEHDFSGMKADEERFGVESGRYHGYLSTRELIEGKASDGGDGKIKSQQGCYTACV